MKNKFIFSSLLLIVFVSVLFTPIHPSQAQTMSISQFIEMLITIGAIAPDKAVSARAVANQFSAPATVISTSTSYIQVLTPNGGEKWEMDLDLPYSITWGSTGLQQVNIALVSGAKNSKTCDLNSTPVNSKNGNNTFKILLKTAKCYDTKMATSTPLASGSYKVRVYFTDSLGNTVKDESNANLTILPKPIPSLKVTYPNGGEQLVRNTEYEVKYKLTNVTNVVNNLIYLYLLDNNGNVAFNSHKTKRSDGIYSLDLPSSLSAGAYKIKLITTTTDEKVEIEDVSDNFFWISTGL